METNSKDTLSWLHGLEELLAFTGSNSRDYVHFYLSLNYADDPYAPLKRLISHANENIDNTLDFARAITFILSAFESISTDSDKELNLTEWSKISQLMNPREDLFLKLNKYFRNYTSNDDVAVISDAFSRSQVRSKVWLVQELSTIQEKFNNILIIASWFGQLVKTFENYIDFDTVRCMDIDKNACNTSDTIFNFDNIENYKVKSSSMDINIVQLHKNGYELDLENFSTRKVVKEKFLPNLIINTSSEHMTEEWFNQIRFKEMESNPIIAIQSNNLFEIPEHVNCVHSVDHMKKKFPMKEILFEGELQLKGYKRFMLIGRP